MLKRQALVWLIAAAYLAGAPVSARAEVGVRVLLGMMDRQPRKWDGSASVDRGKIVRVDHGVLARTMRSGRMVPGRFPPPVLDFLRLAGGETPQVGSNGVILWLSGEDESSEIRVTTARGTFSFKLSDVPYGKFHYALEGNAAVDRIPPSTRLTSSPDEQDYPVAAAAPNGDLWLAYLEFKHRPDHDQLRAPFKETPKDLSSLMEKAAGDQVFVMRYSGNQWSEPMAISAPGGDLYRPALAIDGMGRPWVFWSANEGGNFDLWARVIANGTPGQTVRITNTPGSDVFPVAARDSKGRVCVAWQGWRNGTAASLRLRRIAIRSRSRKPFPIPGAMNGIRPLQRTHRGGLQLRGTPIATAATTFTREHPGMWVSGGRRFPSPRRRFTRPTLPSLTTTQAADRL